MATNVNNDIIGTGWSFPPRPDNRGGIALSRQEADIEESIRVILGTGKGERRMRPNFGCDIHTLTFAPNTVSTWGLAAHYVEDALGWWEPRIEVTQVVPEPSPEDPARLNSTVKYRIKASHDERAIVYPFYLLAGRT